MNAKIFYKSSWGYVVICMCVALTFGYSASFSEPSENPPEAAEENDNLENDIPHDWYEEKGSATALFRFKTGDIIVGGG